MKHFLKTFGVAAAGAALAVVFQQDPAAPGGFKLNTNVNPQSVVSAAIAGAVGLWLRRPNDPPPPAPQA